MIGFDQQFDLADLLSELSSELLVTMHHALDHYRVSDPWVSARERELVEDLMDAIGLVECI